MDNILRQRHEYHGATVNNKTRYAIRSNCLRGCKALHTLQNV